MFNISIFEIILAIDAFFYFMIIPFFSESQYKCEYRERCAFAQILWAILAIYLLWYFLY